MKNQTVTVSYKNFCINNVLTLKVASLALILERYRALNMIFFAFTFPIVYTMITDDDYVISECRDRWRNRNRLSMISIASDRIPSR